MGQLDISLQLQSTFPTNSCHCFYFVLLLNHDHDLLLDGVCWRRRRRLLLLSDCSGFQLETVKPPGFDFLGDPEKHRSVLSCVGFISFSSVFWFFVLFGRVAAVGTA